MANLFTELHAPVDKCLRADFVICMTDTAAADWSNYWQGRTAETAGAALVGSGAAIESDAELAALWGEVFAGVQPETRVLDLACGAGTLLKLAAKAGITRLAGADISEAALEALKAAVPGAVTTVCPADDTPYEDGIFDLVVSQFGFEYAGALSAAQEISRLIAPGGRVAAVAHMTGGAIEREVTVRAEQARAVIKTGFIPATREMFTAMFAPRTDENMKVALAAREAVKGPEEALGELGARDGGFAAYLYEGAGKLYSNRTSYAIQDITGWLDGMQLQIDAFIGRMQGMIDAALSRDEAEAVLAVWAAAGCETSALAPVSLGGEEAAWLLKASRPV